MSESTPEPDREAHLTPSIGGVAKTIGITAVASLMQGYDTGKNVIRPARAVEFTQHLGRLVGEWSGLSRDRAVQAGTVPASITVFTEGEVEQGQPVETV